jgi:hypothetical protein
MCPSAHFSTSTERTVSDSSALARATVHLYCHVDQAQAAGDQGLVPIRRLRHPADHRHDGGIDARPDRPEVQIGHPVVIVPLKAVLDRRLDISRCLPVLQSLF